MSSHADSKPTQRCREGDVTSQKKHSPPSSPPPPGSTMRSLLRLAPVAQVYLHHDISSSQHFSSNRPWSDNHRSKVQHLPVLWHNHIYIMMNLSDETTCVHIGNIRNLAVQAKDKLEIHSRRWRIKVKIEREMFARYNFRINYSYKIIHVHTLRKKPVFCPCSDRV